ncbi:MAG: hypothetical protein IT322_06675, partial [Anaerolineae bacterium]|nr:hypothetical protein [Anaerolineae bacterium]
MLPGGRGWDYVWKCAGLSFEQLQALFDRTNPDGSPWWKWLYTAFYTPLWMLSDVTIKDGVWFHFLNFTPSEQIAFLIGLQQMIRENAEYGGFTVGEVPVSGIDPVMHALA